MKKLGLIFVVFLSLEVFFVPSVVTAQTTSEQLKAAYTPLFKACSDKLGAKLYDPVYKYDKEVTDCLSYGDKANGNTVAADTGVVVKQVATDSAKSLTTQYNQCISDAGNDAQKKSNCESLNTAAKEATSAAASTLTNADVSKIQKETAEKLKVPPTTCTGFDIWCYVQLSITNIIKVTLLNVAGFLVWVSGNLLNYSIQIGILEFSKWAPDTLYPIWIVIRQIVSLFIVFAGLYLGLMYIIGKDENFEKYIPWVVIFALFVNFSYPLTRTLVDVSNVISLNIYSSAVGAGALTADTTSTATAGAQIMAKLGLSKLVASATENNAGVDMVTGISSPAGALMVVAFVLYTAYIFFIISGVIIMRTVALVFLIIASPILFVDSVIPKLGEAAARLRKIYVEQLAVGPVFMIMLALTLKFLQVFDLARGGAISGANNTTIEEIFKVTMMLIMLHIMLKVTKSVSGDIGNMAANAMGKVGGFAGGTALGLASGGAGFLARGTMGRLAAKARDSGWVSNRQDTVHGRLAYNMTNSLAKSSFDARNSSYVQTGAKKLGLGLGMGSNMGFEERAEARDKDRVERLKLVGTYKKNEYYSEGELDSEGKARKAGEVKNKKGSVMKDDPEALAARQQYIEGAAGIKGGSFFNATQQNKLDLSAKLQKADENASKKILKDDERERQEQEAREAIINMAKNNQNSNTAPSSQPSTPSPNNQQPINDFAATFMAP